MRGYRWVILCLVLTGAWTARGATPATQPADDGLAAAAIAAVDSGTLLDFRKDLSDRAATMLGDFKHADLAELARVSLYREFAGYFGRITSPTEEQKASLKFLAGQPHLLPVLMGAVSSFNAPDDVLKTLAALQKDQGAKLDDLAELSTAFLVVWDKPDLETGSKAVVDIAGVVRRYRYFTKAKLRFDVRDLPWQLAVYMVNVKASEPEILWAADRYAHYESIGTCYFDVSYDTMHFQYGTPEKIDSHPYTLQNLVKYGGICADQAYFADQVSKSVGVPSCTCLGQSGSGVGLHAWVGFLQTNAHGVSWDFDTARYKDDLFWEGQIADPQTLQTISDSDLALLAEFSHIDQATRLESEGLTKIIDLADAATRVQLLTRAIDLCPANRPAWTELTRMATGHQLTDAQTSGIGDVVSRRIAQPYPQFACEMLIKVAGVGTVDQQLAALDKVAGLFKTRPDLVGMVRIEQGERLVKANQPERALAAFHDVLANELDGGSVILRAMKRMDDILRTQNALRRLADVYRQTFSRMAIPDHSAFAAGTPYYMIGQEYAGVLDELGDSNAANNVRLQVSSLLTNQAMRAR